MEKEANIKLVQDSNIALQVINKAFQTNDKGINVIIVDNRSGVIDSKSISTPESKKLIPTSHSTEMPAISNAEVGHIDEWLVNELENVLIKFPCPRLPHLMKAAIAISVNHGQTDYDRADWLGMERRRYHHWRSKFKIGFKDI